MRAGVQTGDRIIKVLCLSDYVLQKLPTSHVFFFFFLSLFCVSKMGALWLAAATFWWGHMLAVFQCIQYSPSLLHITPNGLCFIQVNGTLVTHSNHVEVVKLIKCESLYCLHAYAIAGCSWPL